MPASPEKLNLASMDVAADKQRLLRQLFPEAFTETVDEKGVDQVALDFEKLKAVLGEHGALTEPGQERYGLDWPGKRDALRAVQAPSYGTLIPAPEESVDWENTQNVFIEGDNLEVLKLLQKSYYGKVKMIYIDPPYNTGNDFVYPDNYAESLDTYLRYTGKIDDQGFKTTTNSKDSGRFHSNWLRMMYPRLYVAKNLLREDGVIWISCDDNELANLILICKIIYGSENFIGSFIWEKRTTRENRKVFSINHDFIICFSRSKEVFEETRNLLPRPADNEERFSNPDDDPRGDWQSVSLNAQAGPGRRKEQFYTITTPSGRSVDPPAGRCWIVVRERLDELISDNRIWFGEDGSNVPRIKSFRDESPDGITPHTLWTGNEVGTTDSAKKALTQLFDDNVYFDTPKPIELIGHMLRVSTNPNDCIVDFFSGSATTAHSVIALNAEDGGTRRCISIQLPEPCDESSEAFKAGFKTIADIAKERIRRAGSKIRAEWEEKNATLEAATARSEEKKAGDLFAESATSAASSSSNPRSPIPNFPSTSPPDTGFRVFKLAPSNFKRWDGEAAAVSKDALEQQMEASLDHIATGATEESILFEILLKAGYQLTCPMEKLELAGHTVYAIDGNSLFICVADRINKELIAAVAEKHPVQFICLDRALQGNDPLKVNTLETFRAAQPEIQFRTV